MARAVYLQSENPQKLAEYQRILGRHRVPVFSADTRATLEELFARRPEGHRVMAVLRETSDLFPVGQRIQSALPNSEDDSVWLGPEVVLHELGQQDSEGALSSDDLRPLQAVENRTALHVARPARAGQFLVQTYRAVIEGFIQPGSAPKDEEVFGWDDRFATTGTQMTYQEMRRRGLKLSGRDHVLAKFTQKRLAYKRRRDLLAQPQKPERTIDFRRSVADFVRKNPYLNNTEIRRYGAQNSVNCAINEGAFWQAAGHKREGIYWYPSGNGGVPFTPKRNKDTGKADAIHETEFLDHDLGHRWMCPDLLFEGDTDDLSRRVQITWRMMSEALTLVNGSMLFMDTLKKSGVEYDYKRRKIHPLFESLDGDFEHSSDDLKALFYANVRYALRNDDTGFRQLGAEKDKLERYKGKYHAYFVEDYRWTAQNVENMFEDAEKFKKWRISVAPLANLEGYLKGALTVSQCISALAEFKGMSREDLEQMNQDELIELMFDYVYQTTIEPTLTGPPIEIDDDLALKKGFLKYMMAQLYVFDVFDFIPESQAYRTRIVNYIQANIHTLTQDDIDLVRDHYGQFIDLLFKRDVITQEDQQMYKEIFPHFPPHYIYYDGAADGYEALDEVSSKVWNKQAV